MKCCTKCGVEKPLTDFVRDRARKDGREPRCKACNAAYQRAYCAAHRETANARAQAYKRAHPERVRRVSKTYWWKHRGRLLDERFKKKYGISRADKDRMAEAQGGQCACCGAVGDLVLDHCHKSGKVRALLCGLCNAVLGFARDNPEICEKAAAYLRKHS